LIATLLRLPYFRGKDRLVGLIKAKVRRQPYKITYDLRMNLDATEWAQSDLIRDGICEPRTTALFSRSLHCGDTCIDVGAHGGYFTLVGRHHVGSEGHVI